MNDRASFCSAAALVKLVSSPSAPNTRGSHMHIMWARIPKNGITLQCVPNNDVPNKVVFGRNGEANRNQNAET